MARDFVEIDKINKTDLLFSAVFFLLAIGSFFYMQWATVIFINRLTSSEILTTGFSFGLLASAAFGMCIFSLKDSFTKERVYVKKGGN